MDEQLVFIWSEAPFAKVIKDHYTVITSRKTLFSRELSAVEGIFVLAELNWEERYLTKFYGFEILRKLREQRELLCPIVVCSFMPEDFFVRAGEKSGNLFKVLGKPGHSFLPLPFQINHVKQSLGQQLTGEQLEHAIVAFYTTDEALRLIGTQYHSGSLIQDLERLLRGLRQFKQGNKDRIKQFPFSSATGLRKIRRQLAITARVLIESRFLLQQLPKVEFDEIKNVLDPTSMFRTDLDLLISSAENSHKRILLLENLNLEVTINCLDANLAVMKRVRDNL